MNARLALITFLDTGGGNYPDNTLPGVPGYPTHPIAPPPVGIWPNPPGGGFNPVDPGYGQGRPMPPHVGGGPVYPPVYPGHGLPGGPNYPTTGPVFPPVGPDNTLPPGESAPPQVSLPIVLPEGPEGIPPDIHFELKYSYRFGWVIVPITAEPK